MYLTKAQRDIGSQNFLAALGAIRRDFLLDSLKAPHIGSYYFGYQTLDTLPEERREPVKVGLVGTGNEGCEAMIKQSPPDFLRYVAYHDIRPSQIERGAKYLKTIYGEDAEFRFCKTWQEMLDDEEIEAIVIATPLWTHEKFAVEAMERGKHVLCEKLMARYIRQCKRMVRVAEEKGVVLSIGHQRHYSTLYDNVLAVIQSGILGEIKHIQALWHRNNTWPDPADPNRIADSWSPLTPAEDESVPFADFGYEKLKHLICWRLYDYTGGGLMAELGSHQLDACSLFLNKVHPESVAASGAIAFFKDDRQCEDHVYCTYAMPNGVTLTYSSINTNALLGYGEIVYGTRGTLMVMNERDVMLFKEPEPGEGKVSEESYTSVVTNDKKQPSLEWGPPTMTAEATLAKMALDRASWFQPVGTAKMESNRGYREEMEAFAYAIRSEGEYKVRCDGRVALADAVMALAANVAMRSRTPEPLVFDPAWYDPASEAAPDAAEGSPIATTG